MAEPMHTKPPLAPDCPAQEFRKLGWVQSLKSDGLRSLKFSKKQGVLAISLLCLGVGSGFTNPSRSSYEAYATDQTSGFLLQEVCEKHLQAPQVLAQALQQGCQSLAQGNKSDIRQFVHQHTHHYNFGLVSLYTTDLPGYQLRTVGVWRNFLIISFDQN
jgi:hypothetical protein